MISNCNIFTKNRLIYKKMKVFIFKKYPQQATIQSKNNDEVLQVLQRRFSCLVDV